MKKLNCFKYLFLILLAFILGFSLIFAFSVPTANPPGGIKGEVLVATISENKTLIPGIDKPYQFLNPKTNVTLTLDTTKAIAGDKFVIRNTGWYALTINQNDTTLDIIYPHSIREYIFDGTNWVSANVGTGVSGDKNIALGHQAKPQNGAIAIGAFSEATEGVALGIRSKAYQGVAVGYFAEAVQGATIGNWSKASNFGAAIGTYANASNLGSAAGAYAQGSDWGTAIGFKAKGYQQGVGVGAYAKGMRYGVSVGYKAGFNLDENEDRYNVLIGAYAGYRLITGKGNIIIGYQSGYDPIYSPQTGSKNILIGYQAGTPSSNTSNFLNLGNLIFAKGINTASGIEISSGQVGIGTYNPSSALEIVNPNSSQPILILKDDQKNLVLKVSNEGKVGIKVSNPKAELEVDGIIRVLPRNGAVCNHQYEGAIYYDVNFKHLYGCNGTSWVQLDN